MDYTVLLEISKKLKKKKQQKISMYYTTEDCVSVMKNLQGSYRDK